MNLKGTFVGMRWAYTFRPMDLDSIVKKMVDTFRAEFRYAAGEVDYTGALQDGTPLQMSGIKDHVYELRGLAGKEYFLNPTFVVMPYGGFGFRYLFDGSGSTQYGYDRKSHYYYLPFGVDIYKRFPNKWGLGFNVEYDYLISGSQDSLGMTFTQNKGDGARVSMKVVRELKNVTLIAEPFFRYWNIPGSNVVSGYYEPDNTTEELGLRLGGTF